MGCLICIGLFPQKSPIIIGSFAEIALRVTASYAFPPPCSSEREDGTINIGVDKVLNTFYTQEHRSQD